jgi:alpha-acetolactate decarboxylase
MKKNSPFIYLLVATFLISCKNNPNVKRSVHHNGALMNLMSGNLEATVSLDSLQTLPHLYALGALENLKGEIQIFDAASYVSKKDVFNKVKIEPTFDHKAALLVYAQVPEWSDAIPLNEFTIDSQLEKQIKTAALANGINVEKPFPFLIKGKPSLLSWHVINWKDGDKVHTHKKHQESGPRGTFENEEVEIIGFYSEKHKAVFTHHSTFLHMHFKTDFKDGIAGHVDAVFGENVFENQLELYLPEI